MPTTETAADVARRSRVFAALGDPLRLAVVDELRRTDRSPKELAAHLGVPGNLLAHHLDVLEEVGLIERFVSSGDRRRRYVRLISPVVDATTGGGDLPASVLFVCTHNSARSQLAAAAWNRSVGAAASSAGTHPADRVHPGAVDAARRAGLDLADARPRHLDDVESADLVVTVCDRAHEELEPDPTWLHWSVPDPVDVGTAEAFDGALADIDTRIRSLVRGEQGASR
ncbi:helix-turn-helix domain-containing protein [Actinospongicola halichondriae]|uniref:arsenate reductase/protein-tyrosine-phosphatase family protein n=1 Tax=Actinospongicola halichondriae TaxID=3236844 RepID=UPI003D546691